MDEARFREAEQAYEAADYRTAAKLFLAAAGRGSDGNGAAYHRAGNALMKLRRQHDALTVYTHALRDEGYQKRAAVLANLGAAYSAQARYTEAVESYEKALAEVGCETPYKALQGMAGAYWEMGRFEDAARAYRKAALQAENPDPGKALNNLGLSFMRLGRPDDAAEAFKAALGMDSYAGKGRAQANLGLALAASGAHADAVRAFEKAVQLYGHKLSAESVGVLLASRAALEAAGEREVVEGWQTGDITLQVVNGASSQGTGPETDIDGTGPMGAVEPLEEFFTRTDEQMRELDRAARRAARDEKRGQRGTWVNAAAAGGASLLLAAVLIAAYMFGLGWPTQAMAVRGMMDAYGSGQAVTRYWIAVPAGDVDQEMAKVSPTFTGYTIDAVDRTPATSRVRLTVTSAKGAPMHYEVSLAREGVGWRVTGIENDWRSTGG